MSSILQYPDAINPPELQVWNNAAFDNGESEDSIGMTKSSSWWTQSLESSCSKENMSPVFEKPPVSFKSSVSSIPIKPLNSNSNIVNSQGNNKNPMKILLKQGGLVSKIVNQEEETKIDKEIEQIEKEISRLSSRLEALRLEKAERSLNTVEKTGRFVPEKIMEPKQTVKIEEPPKINRRGVSLGPSEIYSATKARLLSKQEMSTPVSTKNRRKSCFWKLEEIDELKATKERGKSSSVSPRSRKNLSKVQAPKMAATTIGSRKSVKKEDGILASIQPKTLFKDGQKSVPNKKPVKPGRVVPSRYNQIATNQSDGNFSARKRSLPDSDKEDANKRRASRENGANQRIESSSKAKKKWEIPSELVMFKSDDAIVGESLKVKSPVADVLPKIKTFRSVNETPRDSGAAKRVADLVGKKSFFSINEGEETAGDSICQALRFDFEEEDV
ncbi:uncharacterized protein LOC8284976 [Ricinus communis]|uniref:Uncharacterized protein n=1 Tax=Ricinus communis TaxID=3988 RepID=B9RW73_RICCO|nr:uncharacterized protein LOC8284976 [Ricinus communis]EEF44510.1 conserved hypothetical protein [Ricinus communis]|eukprot:XP_002517992.1 uncharacterized protein LOC8284976 [Ricinus communis]